MKWVWTKNGRKRAKEWSKYGVGTEQVWTWYGADTGLALPNKE
ncbi:MAG: hypothetical protein Q4D56_15450 [Bacteroides sp.]|nr:hypothetical protein [Bacteroides sp.]